MDDGDFAWACFKSQQAAEMAAKGFIRAGGGLATGYSVVSLLQAAVETVPDGLAHCARELDKVSIPTRHPDVYDAGSPHEARQEPAGRGRGQPECVYRFTEVSRLRIERAQSPQGAGDLWSIPAATWEP